MAVKNLSIDWKQYQKEHTVTLEETAKAVKPGDVFWLGQASTIPYPWLEEMYAHMDDYHDVTLIYNVMNQPASMAFDTETKKHFKMISAYCLPVERMAIDMNTIEPGAIPYDTLQYAPFEYGCNSIATHVCPPDEEGYCNIGAYGVATNSIVNRDPRVTKRICFIDKTGVYPVPGDRDTHYIHISEMDYICEIDCEPTFIPSPLPTPVDEKIASFLMPYIHDGDNVQIGFGGLGEEILRNLQKADGTFSIYSEVACDNMQDLVESGKVKKIVACSPGSCSEKFFNFMRDDPRITLRRQPEMIDPLGVMMCDNLVSINATFMVDLIGQACSEAQGLTPYTGPGGSFAYFYGAMRSKGGRSFLTLRSTFVDHDGERHSNIVPWLPEGSIVTTTKSFVMYLVTEWGVANVYLKSLKDRIRATLKIAHPDYRKELQEQICTTALIKEDDFADDYDLFDNVPK
ncbi:MAG: acetyl-CoA hydrolase/transferase C-terminal domain-containing protein [Oscillospiraceae bacterium]